MNFGSHLKSLRKSKGLTGSELSNMVGKTQSYICGVENNRIQPSPKYLRAISEVFEVPYVVLLLSAGILKSEDLSLEKMVLSDKEELLVKNNYHPRDPERVGKIISQFKSGVTQQEIANSFNVSRQYVQQVLKRAGLNKFDGGRALRPKKNEGSCKVEGCKKKAKTKGYCGTHYQRIRVHGKEEIVFKNAFHVNDGGCLVDGCELPFTSNGLCNKHRTSFYLNKRNGNVMDLNDFLKVQKAKQMMGKRYALFEEIRKYMSENSEQFEEDLYVK